MTNLTALPNTEKSKIMDQGLTLAQWAYLTPRLKAFSVIQYAKDMEMESFDYLYILKSLEVFEAFVAEAHRVVSSGKTHYSARTITEYLRHNTAVTDSEAVFKINNHLIPKMARLSMQLFPLLNGLFEVRGK